MWAALASEGIWVSYGSPDHAWEYLTELTRMPRHDIELLCTRVCESHTMPTFGHVIAIHMLKNLIL